MNQSEQIQADNSGRQRPANIAKDDQARLARQIAAAARREGPKVHPLAPLWPTIAEILSLNHSLRHAVKKLKAEGFDLSLSQAVRYRKKLGLPGYPDAALPLPVRVQAAPRPASTPLPTVTTSHAPSSAELPQRLEPIESQILATLSEKEKAKYWSMAPDHQKMFLRRKLERMIGDR